MMWMYHDLFKCSPVEGLLGGLQIVALTDQTTTHIGAQGYVSVRVLFSPGYM